MNQIMKMFIKTKKEKTTIRSDMLSSEIVVKAKKEDKIYVYNETTNTNFCLYRTNYKDEDAIIMVFILDIEGKRKGSYISELTMGIIEDMIRYIGSIDHTYFNRDVTKDGKSIGFLKLIKIIKEDDLI